MQTYIKKFSLIAFTLCVIVAAGCTTKPDDSITVQAFKLNTFVQITGYGSDVTKEMLDDALLLCDKYEKIFSRTLNDSELSKLNRHEITTVSNDLGKLIELGIQYSKASDGNFDISIMPISSLWDFTLEPPKLPDYNDINSNISKVDYRKIEITKNPDETYEVFLPEGMGLDLGAIAKGYIADRIKEDLLSKGIWHALINLGGNVLCVGGKTDKTNFNIGIKKPFSDENIPLKTLDISDLSVVSSGTYERCFYIDNKLYHHILNPKTGYPYDSTLTQVTIISKDSVIGDCLSTTCFTLGLEKGLELINKTEDVEAIFVCADGTITLSDGCSKYILK